MRIGDEEWTKREKAEEARDKDLARFRSIPGLAADRANRMAVALTRRDIHQAWLPATAEPEESPEQAQEKIRIAMRRERKLNRKRRRKIR